MRDVGLFVWVVLLFVGVIGSMVSRVRSLRSQRSSQPRPQRISRPVPPISAPSKAPVAPPAPSRVSPAPEHVDRAMAASSPRRRALFADRRDAVRAVIASEVLGKPRALYDERPIP